MDKNKFFLFLAIVLLMCFGCATTQVSKESVTIITDDQKKIAATYYPAPSPNSPGVILIPDTRCDRKKSFGRFPSTINKAGFAVLALDLRYKDLIARARSKEEAISLIQKQDLYALVKFDIKSAIDFLSRQEEVNPERIALIGTSLGTRVGLISGVKYKVKALVLISLSGEEALSDGKPIKQLLEEYGDRPILFMTSEKDWGANYKAAEHNKLYFNWAKGEKELKIWPGSSHGPDIFNIEEAFEFMLSWLKDNL
jgi:dienelactone hydrolase